MKILGRLLAVLCVLQLVAGCGGRTHSASRLHEKKGGFSYVTPDGWTRKRVSGMGYQTVAYPEVVNGIKPNIFVIKDVATSSLSEFMGSFMMSEKKANRSMSLTPAVDFRTDSGVAGKRVNATGSKNGVQITREYYFFNNGKVNVAITCTADTESWANFDLEFDAAMRSFEFDQP